MGLLDLGLRAEEHSRLAVVVGEALGADANLGLLHRDCGRTEAALGVFARTAVLAGFRQAVRFIVRAALEHLRLHVPVALEVLERAASGLVDRQLVEVHRAEPRQLRVLVRKQPALQQGVFRDVDARRHVGRQEGRLLGLCEEVIDVSIQHHPADHPDRRDLLRDQLGRVQDVERQGIRLFLREQLHAELPLRKVAGFDGFIEVAAVEIRVGPGDLHRLVPARRLGAQFRPPVELDQRRLALGVDQPEGVDAEPLHHPQRSRQGSVAHRPHHHVGALGHQPDEVPERVVGARRLRIAFVRLHFHRVDQVGKLDGVLDEEDWDIVANEVPVALLRVELDGEAADVAGRVDGARAPCDG